MSNVIARPGDIDTIAQPLRPKRVGTGCEIAPESPLPMMVLPVSKEKELNHEDLQTIYRSRLPALSLALRPSR